MHPCASAAHACGRAEVRTTLMHAEADRLSRASHAQQQQWCIVDPLQPAGSGMQQCLDDADCAEIHTARGTRHTQEDFELLRR